MAALTLPPGFAAAADDAPKLSAADQLRAVRTWGCQFQNIDVALLAATDLDLIVVDHALAVPGQTIANARDIARLKEKPDGTRRLVFAYLSVGEAENFRPYWQRAWISAPPAWLGTANPEWPGAYAVRYWEQGWQDIVFAGPQSLLAKIVDAGFDGAFLDRVDAYMSFAATRPNARQEMIALVAALRDTARAKAPDFLIMAQNAEPLLRLAPYRAAIDAVSKESLFYGLSAPGLRNTQDQIAWSMQGLGSALANGLPVFAIEYLDDPAKIAIARRELLRLGMKPFFATRALDRLPIEN